MCRPAPMTFRTLIIMVLVKLGEVCPVSVSVSPFSVWRLMESNSAAAAGLRSKMVASSFSFAGRRRLDPS